jgi:hypothetical protein
MVCLTSCEKSPDKEGIEMQSTTTLEGKTWAIWEAEFSRINPKSDKLEFSFNELEAQFTEAPRHFYCLGNSGKI